MVGEFSSAWIAAALAFSTVALGTISLALTWEWLRQRRWRKKITRQLERLASEGFGEASTAPGELYRRQGTRAAWLGPLTRKVPQLQDAEILIEQADLNWSVQTYLLLAVGFALALGVAILIATGNLLLATVAAAVGAALPHVYLRRLHTRRMRSFEEQLPEAVDLLGRALRAGHPISSGFKMVADEAPEPVAGEFRRVFEQQRFGLPFEDSLLGMADRIPLMDVRIFVTAVLIQREVGGNLAEILDKLSYVIRERFSILRQLRVYTAQGRMSGYILAALPLLLGVGRFMTDRENMLVFINAPLGRFLIVMAALFQIVGFLWIRRIIKIEV